MHCYMHPFLLLPDLGKLITVNRLSCVKHIINNSTKQEKNAFYRVFLLLIEVLKRKHLIINTYKIQGKLIILFN